MADGGIHDQIGGGFHRYATDADWLVPHFEKMLYDNAQLARVYLHAYQLTGEPRFREVVESTLDYLVREMRTPNGLFAASQDADTDGKRVGRTFGLSMRSRPCWLGRRPMRDRRMTQMPGPGRGRATRSPASQRCSRRRTA